MLADIILIFGCSGETEDTFIADLSVGLATVLSHFSSSFVLVPFKATRSI